jgi:hypothetical protein|uniref:Uncharacterized protein n=1 Tax=virus sp. ct9pU4 TaxID=2828248 RepID=A0A8S5RAV2_9VIRU|nr:MAG TPA: hypothetical protein [virus sp. ct9pU4]
MKLIDVNKINWEKIFGGCVFPLDLLNEDYDSSIKPEDYTWKVISKTEPDTPIEEDFNPWTDREYAL